MLVLGRRQNEEILIGDDIRIRVQRVRGKMVSLAIVALDDVPVLRSELADRTSPGTEDEVAFSREMVTPMVSGSL